MNSEVIGSLERIPPFKTLDAFRGLAAIWVVMVHSCFTWLSVGHDAYRHQPLYAFALQGQLGVLFFFVISGYCITAACYSALVSRKSIWTYSYQRIRRIYPPYLAAFILTALAAGAIHLANSRHWIPPVNHLDPISTDPKFWIANTLIVQYEFGTLIANKVFWSLCYEISFYAVMGVFLFLAQQIAAKRSLRAGTIVFISAIGLSTVASLSWTILVGPPIFPFDFWHYFSIGGLLFFLLEFKPQTVRNFTPGFRGVVVANMLAASALMILFSVQFGIEGHKLEVAKHLLQAPPALAFQPFAPAYALLFCLLLIGLRGVDEKISMHPLLKPLMWSGTFSYSLYLTHTVILPFIDILGRRAGFNDNRYWITFWIEVAVAIGFGYLFYLVVERRFISKHQVQRLAAEHLA